MPNDLKRPLTTTGSVSPPTPRKKVIVQQSARTCEADTQHSALTRIISWNVNGARAFLQNQISFNTECQNPLRQFLKRQTWPAIVCLQEVKISIKDEVTQRRLQLAANARNEALDEPTYTIFYSLPRDKYNATAFGGKIHGVATLVRDDVVHMVGNTRRPGWDLEGRVLIHSFGANLIVINGYWVNGTSHPYRNLSTGAVEGTRHDHKLRFHEHMLDEAQEFIRQGKHIVMVGDVNVARGPINGHPDLRCSPAQHVVNRADFNAKFFTDRQGLEAIDVFREMHANTRKYTYHPRGYEWGQSCDRVDLIMVTRSLWESGGVTATDICDSPQARGHSDHVPLWIDLDVERISTTSIDPLIARHSDV